MGWLSRATTAEFRRPSGTTTRLRARHSIGTCASRQSSLLSPPGDAHRTAAGMFTISYSCAVVIPTFSGALWDFTALPWLAFVPLGLCAITLTVLGTML